METKVINIAEAKAHLSELAELAASGETVLITKRGKPLAKLSKLGHSRTPVDLTALRQLTDRMPQQEESAADFMRRIRDEARY